MYRLVSPFYALFTMRFNTASSIAAIIFFSFANAVPTGGKEAAPKSNSPLKLSTPGKHYQPTANTLRMGKEPPGIINSALTHLGRREDEAHFEAYNKKLEENYKEKVTEKDGRTYIELRYNGVDKPAMKLSYKPGAQQMTLHDHDDKLFMNPYSQYEHPTKVSLYGRFLPLIM